MTQLVTDLAARATTEQLADAIATREAIFAELPQSRVTQLVSDLATRATTQQLADAIATREPIFAELPQSRVTQIGRAHV